jgi:hypothetical protein
MNIYSCRAIKRTETRKKVMKRSEALIDEDWSHAMRAPVTNSFFPFVIFVKILWNTCRFYSSFSIQPYHGIIFFLYLLAVCSPECLNGGSCIAPNSCGVSLELMCHWSRTNALYLCLVYIIMDWISMWKKNTYVYIHYSSISLFKSSMKLKLLGKARRVQDFWTWARFIEYFWTRDPDPDPTD